MTPREKAIELQEKFSTEVNPYHSSMQRYKDNNKKWKRASKCALIAVDEILSELPDTVHGWVDMPHNILIVDNIKKQYWQQVKTEIENL
jgi:hypothetical protein